MKKVITFVVSLFSQGVIMVLSSIDHLYIKHNWFRELFGWVILALAIMAGIIAHGLWNVPELLCFVIVIMVYCGIMLLLENMSQE